MLEAEPLVLGGCQTRMFLEGCVECGFIGVTDRLGDIFDSIPVVFGVFQILAGLADPVFIDKGIEILPVVFVNGC